MSGDTAAPDRPLVTFALFAYNQEQYIREAIEGAFAQTYEPLEIILSDDCSSDRTFEIMQEMAEAYRGPHQLFLNRNSVNLGLARHVNEALASARGEIIVIAAGDDISRADRSDETVRILQANPDAVAVSFALQLIDASGQDLKRTHHSSQTGKELAAYSLKDLYARRGGSPGASRAIRQDVFARFGPLMPDCPTEDTPLLLRSLLMGRLLHSSRPAVRYRIHETNLSGIQNLKRMQEQATHITAQYLADLDRARTLAMVDAAGTRSVERWIVKSGELRELRCVMHEQPPTLRVALRTLGRRGLSLRASLGYWKSLFRHFILPVRLER